MRVPGNGPDPRLSHSPAGNAPDHPGTSPHNRWNRSGRSARHALRWPPPCRDRRSCRTRDRSLHAMIDAYPMVRDPGFPETDRRASERKAGRGGTAHLVWRCVSEAGGVLGTAWVFRACGVVVRRCPCRVGGAQPTSSRRRIGAPRITGVRASLPLLGKPCPPHGPPMPSGRYASYPLGRYLCAASAT